MPLLTWLKQHHLHVALHRVLLFTGVCFAGFGGVQTDSVDARFVSTFGVHTVVLCFGLLAYPDHVLLVAVLHHVLRSMYIVVLWLWTVVV